MFSVLVVIASTIGAWQSVILFGNGFSRLLTQAQNDKLFLPVCATPRNDKGSESKN
jgi:hypothetical protein